MLAPCFRKGYPAHHMTGPYRSANIIQYGSYDALGFGESEETVDN